MMLIKRWTDELCQPQAGYRLPELAMAWMSTNCLSLTALSCSLVISGLTPDG